MMMTREDVLRELELLPVWQLRAPAASAAAPSANVSPQVAEVNLQVTASAKTPVNTQPEQAEITEKSQPLASETNYFALVSDDKNWVFVLPKALTGAADTLFNNILLALQINKTHSEALSNLASAKVIIAFGDIVAQQLLSVSDSFEQLRGKPQLFLGAALIVTYHPNDLLQDLALKPKLWDDLCIAKSLIAS